MSDVSIKYKGGEIAALDDSGTKTLKTSGKYCEGDVTVEYVKPQGGLVPVVEIDGKYWSTTALRFTHDANTLDAGTYLVEITFTRSRSEYKCFMWLKVVANSKTGVHTYDTGNLAKPSNACTVDGTSYMVISSATASGGNYFLITASNSIFSSDTVSSAELYHAEDVFA